MELDLTMKKLLLALALCVVPSLVWAQCNGVFPANTFCGNNTGSPKTPAPISLGGSGIIGPSSSTSGDAATWVGTGGNTLTDTKPGSLSIAPTSVASNTLAQQLTQYNVNIRDFGAIGDGGLHPLSSKYATLAAAQAVYPFVSDLTQEIDWAATQQAINYTTSNYFQNTFCPAATKANGGGGYQLSNPIFIDSAGNARGIYTAWTSASTYVNGANVSYNGLPWASLGSGNQNNPPTAASGYPANLGIAGSPVPFANVLISVGTSATVTLSNHGFAAGQALVFLPDTYDSGAALPSGLNANQVYYVLSASLSTNTFLVSATPSGAAVTTSTSGVGVFTASTQVWQLAPRAAPNFSDRSNFIGDKGQPSEWGCRFTDLSVTTPAFYIGPNNGNYVSNIYLLGGTPNIGTGGTATYRCQAPTGLVGIGTLTTGGGAHSTMLDNIGADGFYADYETDIAGSGTLGDSNTWIKPNFSDACFGLLANSSQNFINSVYDGLMQQDTDGIVANLGQGVGVWGGNYSTFSGLWNELSITSVSVVGAANTFTMSATVTNAFAQGSYPDGTLNNPLCGYNLQCGYNIVSIISSNYGLTPWHITAFNPFTQRITLALNNDWQNAYGHNGQGDFASDILSQAILYPAETLTTFQGGGIEVHSVHVENDGVPTTIMNASTAFGSDLPSIMDDVLLNWEVSGTSGVCCNASNQFNSRVFTQFYAQQNTPVLAASNSLIVKGLSGGGNDNWIDRVLYEGGGHFVMGGLSFNGGLQVNFGRTGLVGITCQTQQFTYCYNADASPAFGVGQYETPTQTVAPTFSYNNFQPDSAPTSTDPWRTLNWGQAPTWGVRPAPWANPCITPAQSTALNSPSISFTSQLVAVNIVSAGTSYSVGDTVTLAGGTATTSGMVTVGSVNGSGGITGLQIQGSYNVTNQNSYTVEPTTFTQGATSGSGHGATFNTPVWLVKYTTGYPLLWGGSTYNVCDYQTAALSHYSIRSTNLGYSYFTNLTSANVPNLSWTAHDGSRDIYMNQEALQLMFPGLVFALPVPTGGTTGCTATSSEYFIVTGVYPTMGYVEVYDAEQNGIPYTVHWGLNRTCTGTTIAMSGTNIVNPF